MTEKMPLAIGIEDYKRIRSYYYVDKTLLIKDILDKGGYVNLFTRPRRFGKTLALSMIKTFFELEYSENGDIIDNTCYFDGMKIMEAGEKYTKKLGKFPVVFLSLKSAKQPTFEMAYEKLQDEIIKEYVRHRYILNGNRLINAYKKRYQEIIDRTASAALYASSLEFLSVCLQQYYKKNVIILLDEYDVPLENSYLRGFYNEMTDFIRSLFESALKTNSALEFSVITGCLRISRESIFTGLNNLKVASVTDNSYAEYFGFTQQEVDQMLKEYELEEKKEEIKKWYNGYLFGNTEVYNPWSLCCYLYDRIEQNSVYPKPYWSNTSSNNIIRNLVEKSDGMAKQELEMLLSGNFIEKPIHEEITYADINHSKDNLWNFLFFTGYLKAAGHRFEQDTIFLKMQIPNAEVGYIYRNTIREWFESKVETADFIPFYESILNKKCEKAEGFLTEQLAESISYYDNAESFYHGYLLGVLKGLKGYEIASNKEAGEGRPDIVLSPFSPKKPAIIIEVKSAKKFGQMDAQCETALIQIEEKKYDAELLDKGYENIIKYGICFCKKTCMVKCKK